jgi:hypothetical protein
LPQSVSASFREEKRGKKEEGKQNQTGKTFVSFQSGNPSIAGSVVVSILKARLQVFLKTVI